MSPRLPDPDSEKKETSTPEAKKDIPSKQEEAPIILTFQFKDLKQKETLLSDAKKLSDDVLKISQEPKGDKPKP